MSGSKTKEPTCTFLIESQRCTGCHACEIACTFHHYGYFSRRKSSIEVQYDAVTGKAEIQRYQHTEGEHPGCDYCRGESEFWCVKYCAHGAIRVSDTRGETK